MEDLIRRSDAIAILEDLQSKHLQFCLVPFRIAIEKMEAIPSADIDLSGYSDKLWKNAYERGKADRPQDWIPCSERMPEEPFDCLVTVEDSYFDGSGFIDCESILPYFVGWDGEQWNDCNGGRCPFEILAWMPLPEPWKGADSE